MQAESEAPHKFSHENPALDRAHEHHTSVGAEKVCSKHLDKLL